MTTRRLLLAVPLLVALVLALVPAGASATNWRSCKGADPANGIEKVWRQRGTCKAAVAVAKRTNSIKCFLNGSSCTHTFRRRKWTCRLKGDDRVICRSGRRGVRYRLAG